MKFRHFIPGVLLVAPFFLFAQIDSTRVLLKDGSVKTAQNVRASFIDSFNATAIRYHNKTLAVVQFATIPSVQDRQQLSGKGIELLDYIPNNAYTVSIEGTLFLSDLLSVKARSIFSLTPQQKMHLALKESTLPPWAVKVKGTIDVWISFPRTFLATEVISALKEKGFDIISTEFGFYKIIAVRLSVNRLPELASFPFIEYVQPVPPQAQPLNGNSRSGSRATVLNASVVHGGKGLNGEGIAIGVGDNADVQFHADFSGRLINRSGVPAANHGTHTSGTAVGAGIINELYRGYAPKATLVSQTFTGILTNAATYVQDYGMVVTNNSYGSIAECYYNGIYDLTSRIVDQQAFDLPSLQHVFAAGNSGTSQCTPFPAGFRTVLGGFQSSKNVLTVGATAADGASLWSGSSKGPVRDGRVKPEIVAMGVAVTSAWSNNGYNLSWGTSMAAPAVTGGLALLYQRYRQLHSGADPKSALMKALVCNGAADRGAVGPDFGFGFGWMNLLRSVDMLENNRYYTALSTTNAVHTSVISVPANTASLKVMLYWHDPAASVISNQTLVNDLDLQVQTPSSTIILPVILDTLAANVANAATTGVDHINNMEQVVINNPAVGTYSVRVNGTAITQNPSQEFFVVYDVVPVSLKLTNPVGGEGEVPGEFIKIVWDAYGNAANTFTLQYSTDAGSNWNNIDTAVPAQLRQYIWEVPAVITNQALIRIIQNGTFISSTSGAFIIIGVPSVTLSAVQCEGYIALQWSAVSGATDYEVMMLKNDEMVPVAATTNTGYSLSGLSTDSTYFVSVRARVAGKGGRRTVALSRKPNSGTCSGVISDNDLKLEAFLSPTSGRKATSTELSAAKALVVQVKNLDDAPATDFTIRYSVNGGTWIAEQITTTIAVGATYNHTFATTVNLASIGTYAVTAVVTNTATDIVTANDTLHTTIKQLDNQPLLLSTPFVDDLENASAKTYTIDTTGLDGADRYDFENGTPYGRLRTFVNTGLAYSGSKALTIDVDRYYPSGNVNYIRGTFNLSNYTAANDLRLDFQYNNHGRAEHSSNKVWIRGGDTQPWIEVYDLDNNEADPGTYKKTYSLELSDILTLNGQTFSSSFGVRWGGFSQLQATDRETGSGYTFDDIRLYEVVTDVQALSLDEPVTVSCGLGVATPVRISVRNSSNTTLSNIPVLYRINGGPWVSEIISSINGNATIQHIFNTPADFSAFGIYTIQAVVNYSSDSFRDNDTTAVTITNTPIITSFPHLQNFESSNGYWYTGGKNTSWEYGTPASGKMNGAASGARAWKTRLAGQYNDSEASYLYSPCYDISSLTTPTLSFSVALDLEDGGATFYDGAWVEYSADGTIWSKLGASGTGTNWYNKPGNQAWSIENYTRWHVATIPLPIGISRLRLRFVLQSDVGVSREGISIDDIHIYDNTGGIYDGITLSSPVTQSVTGGTTWVHFESGGKKIASLQPNNQNMGTTEVQAYINSGPVRHTGNQYNQYYHNRNITIKPGITSLSDSVTIRFYFLDTEAEALLSATGCATCSKPSDAYELGISKYSDGADTVENGTITDNNTGVWSFIAAGNTVKVPFDKGYYAEFKVKDFSEFWLSNGSFNGLTPLPATLLTFDAKKKGINDVIVTWTITEEINVRHYEVEVARSTEEFQANRFSKIGDVPSVNSTIEKQYSFVDKEGAKTGLRYYRLKMINRDGSVKYSSVQSLLFTDVLTWHIYPNPSTGIFQFIYQVNRDEKLLITITDAAGKLVQTYKPEGNGFVQKQLIDLSKKGFAAGVYLLRVAGKEKVQTFKLYKQ